MVDERHEIVHGRYLRYSRNNRDDYQMLVLFGGAWLAKSVQHVTLDLLDMSLSSMLGTVNVNFYLKKS